MDRRHNPCRDYIIHSMGHYLCIVMPGDLRLHRKFSFQEVAVSHPGDPPPPFFWKFFWGWGGWLSTYTTYTSRYCVEWRSKKIKKIILLFSCHVLKKSVLCGTLGAEGSCVVTTPHLPSCSLQRQFQNPQNCQSALASIWKRERFRLLPYR